MFRGVKWSRGMLLAKNISFHMHWITLQKGNKKMLSFVCNSAYIMVCECLFCVCRYMCSFLRCNTWVNKSRGDNSENVTQAQTNAQYHHKSGKSNNFVGIHHVRQLHRETRFGSSYYKSSLQLRDIYFVNIHGRYTVNLANRWW